MISHRRYGREFEAGIREFNQHKFFQCHETLEHLWKRQGNPEKEFTQGLIQIAVAYHHLLNHNLVGARKLLTRGLNRISPYQPTFSGVNVKALVEAVTESLADVAHLESKVQLDMLDIKIAKIQLLPPPRE